MCIKCVAVAFQSLKNYTVDVHMLLNCLMGNVGYNVHGAKALKSRYLPQFYGFFMLYLFAPLIIEVDSYCYWNFCGGKGNQKP